MPTLSRIVIAAAADDVDAVQGRRVDAYDRHARTPGGRSAATQSCNMKISSQPLSSSSQHTPYTVNGGIKRRIGNADVDVEYSAPPLRKKNGLDEEGRLNQSWINSFVDGKNTNECNKKHDDPPCAVQHPQGTDTTNSVSSTSASSSSATIGHTQHLFHHNAMATTAAPPASIPHSNVSCSPSIPFTRVDGKGLWRSWKRNFKNKLLALLDLIDNSLDASIITGNTNRDKIHDDNDEMGENGSRNTRSNFVGRVHIYPDDVGIENTVLPNTATSSSTILTAAGAGAAANDTTTTTTATMPTPSPPSSSTNGLCIINNSFHPIRPLVQVLEVYNSSKIHSGAHDIGENGVGLKQGCATLSDLSFVLVKNGVEGFVELGIIAESLQMPEGCYLPSFRFNIFEGGNFLQSLKNEMTTLFNKLEHSNVARCIERYGYTSVQTNSDKLPLEKGIDRLCKHFHSILNFFDSRFVFAVILNNVTYGDRHYSNRTSSQFEDPIKDLRLEIPRTYLHIPHGFDFRIGSSNMNREKIIFDYWPQRLVELSSFSVHVNECVPWHHGNDDVRSYKLRVFVGFDRMRINSTDEVKSASMYVYSRHSGRLIKYEPDARFILGLNASGSMYCSGLTILVDDMDGKLPLNPTKQDIAFGEQANGNVHKDNLFMWVGAVTRFFYDYHLSKFDQKKTDLTEKIKHFGPELINERMKEIDRCQLTTFDVQYTFYGEKSIRIKRNPKEIAGRDTCFSLIPDAPCRRVISGGDGDSRRRIDHSQQISQQQQYQPFHAHSSVGVTQGVVQTTNSVQQSLPGGYAQQAAAPVNNRGGEKKSNYFRKAASTVNTFTPKGNAFQALLNRHRDDVVRLMKDSAAKGLSSVSTHELRNQKIVDIRVANFNVYQSGGTMLKEEELQSLFSQAEQEAVNVYKQGLRPVNAPVETRSCSMEVGEQDGRDSGDDNSVSSSKSYYKDLCTRLTTTLEKRNEVNCALRSEIANLKESLEQRNTANHEMRDEITNLKEILRGSGKY